MMKSYSDYINESFVLRTAGDSTHAAVHLKFDLGVEKNITMWRSFLPILKEMADYTYSRVPIKFAFWKETNHDTSGHDHYAFSVFDEMNIKIVMDYNYIGGLAGLNMKDNTKRVESLVDASLKARERVKKVVDTALRYFENMSVEWEGVWEEQDDFVDIDAPEINEELTNLANYDNSESDGVVITMRASEVGSLDSLKSFLEKLEKKGAKINLANGRIEFVSSTAEFRHRNDNMWSVVDVDISYDGKDQLSYQLRKYIEEVFENIKKKISVEMEWRGEWDLDQGYVEEIDKIL